MLFVVKIHYARNLGIWRGRFVCQGPCLAPRGRITLIEHNGGQFEVHLVAKSGTCSAVAVRIPDPQLGASTLLGRYTCLWPNHTLADTGRVVSTAPPTR